MKMEIFRRSKKHEGLKPSHEFDLDQSVIFFLCFESFLSNKGNFDVG